MASLLLIGLATSPPGPTMPASAFETPFSVTLNRGPSGEFPAPGCMELALRVDADGQAQEVRILHSSRYYPIDRAVLLELKNYRFNASGLPANETWRVYFSWSKDGRDNVLSGQCRPGVA